MANWTGTEFVGLDSEAAGADTPADTWLLHRSRGNNLYLNSRRACSATFWAGSTDALNTNTGHRPFMAVGDWQSLQLFDLYADSSWAGIEVVGCYNVQSEGATQNDIKAKFTLDGAGEHEFTISNTDNAGSPSFETFSETWTFQSTDRDILTDTEAARRFTFWIRSEPGASSAWDTLSDVDSIGHAHVTDANGDITNITSGAPTSSSLELKYVRYEDGDVSELLGINPDGSNPEVIYVWPRPAVTGKPGVISLEIVDGVFIQLRSLSIRPIYRDEAVTELKQSEMLPQSTLDGVDTVEHPYALRRMRARPRLVLFGPTGYQSDTDEEWPSSYAQMWPYQQADGSGQTYLIDEGVFIDGENPVVTVDMYVICTMFSPQYWHRSEARATGEVTWDFTLDIDQMDDGDTAWASATNVLDVDYDDYSVPMYPANYRLGRYQMIQALLHDYSNFATSSPENYGWCYREGTLIQSDIPLMRRITLTGQMSGFTTRQENPVRLTVGASLNTVISTPWSEQVSSGDINPRIRLTLVGYSVHTSHDIDPDG